MSARIGRMGRRLDENVRPERPLDANPDVSAPRAGRSLRVACALGGAIACGFVIPATAHAADPFGTAQLVQQVNQQVNAAVTQATTAVPHASAAVAVNPANPADPSKTMEAATKSLEVATKQAAAIASNAVAEAQRATQSAAIASVPSASGIATRPRAKNAHRRAAGHRHRAAGHSPAQATSLRPRSSLLAATSGGAARLLASPSGAHAGRPQSSGASASRAPSKPTRSSLPQRSPPPRTPQPGAAMTSQGGGQGPLTPLVVGALAAVLLIMILEFLPRTLPPKAFRKPRLIALTPWHPG
jgi:hypothetical protein